MVFRRLLGGGARATLAATAAVVLAAGSLVATAPAHAAGTTITMPNYTAAMIDGSSTVLLGVGGVPQQCINASPSATENARSSDAVANGGAQTAYLAHGFVVDGQFATCPRTFDAAVQSNLGFTPMAPASAEAGAEFLLGRVVHNNNVIAADPNQTHHMTGKLSLVIGDLVDTFDWNLTETANMMNGVQTPVDDVTSSPPPGRPRSSPARTA